MPFVTDSIASFILSHKKFVLQLMNGVYEAIGEVIPNSRKKIEFDCSKSVGILNTSQLEEKLIERVPDAKFFYGSDLVIIEYQVSRGEGQNTYRKRFNDLASISRIVNVTKSYRRLVVVIISSFGIYPKQKLCVATGEEVLIENNSTNLYRTNSELLKVFIRLDFLKSSLNNLPKHHINLYDICSHFEWPEYKLENKSFNSRLEVLICRLLNHLEMKRKFNGISDDEDEYSLQEQSIRLRIIKLASKYLKDQPMTTEARLKKFFELNDEDYHTAVQWAEEKKVSLQTIIIICYYHYSFVFIFAVRYPLKNPLLRNQCILRQTYKKVYMKFFSQMRLFRIENHSNLVLRFCILDINNSICDFIFKIIFKQVFPKNLYTPEVNRYLQNGPKRDTR